MSDRLMMLAHDRALAEARPLERQTYTFATQRDTDRHALIGRLLVDVAPLVDGDLWEFLHVASGAAPQLGPDGQWLVTDDTGIVLVLVPGVIVELGAQATDPRAANYDPAAEANEGRRGQNGSELVRAILAPYFVGKYEVTQSQWRRIAAVNPAYYQPGASAAVLEAYSDKEPPTSAIALETHPVESVDWHVARDQLQAVGLTLPSEAQWEYVARAGTTTPWSSGLERPSVFRIANLADARYVRHYRDQYREDIGSSPMTTVSLCTPRSGRSRPMCSGSRTPPTTSTNGA